MLNAKYFTNGDIFHPKCIDKPSYTWQSITSVARMFKNGFDWMVADGKSIDIRRDNWDFEGLTGGLNNNLLVGDYTDCIDWVEDAMRVPDQKAFSDFITIFWNFRTTKIILFSRVKRMRPGWFGKELRPYAMIFIFITC
ncbi:hypothetical protein PVK06_036104 [Gossypium arboreum]|uniref:Uncharacterized protein n=1 Tax=Gossypium arboreum TaxID=29729 RepID=A0ABR0NKS2_GOSAR|nr:hypothetical protein PVK06_036104 [Gossypium arboreum]